MKIACKHLLINYMLLVSPNAHSFHMTECILQAQAAVQDRSLDCQFYEAAFKGDLSLIKQLFHRDAIPNCNTKDGSGMTALMNATWQGNHELVDFLLAHGADPNAQNNQGSTALIMAIITKHHTLIGKLLDAGADIQMQDLYGWGPLFWATLHQSSEIMHLLITMGADPTLTDSQGKTAYNYAIDTSQFIALLSSACSKAGNVLRTETELDAQHCETILKFVYNSSLQAVPSAKTIDTLSNHEEEKAANPVEDVAVSTMQQLTLETKASARECRCIIN